jgi:OmcA/MtrC family decaheme c-type cytochrome
MRANGDFSWLAELKGQKGAWQESGITCNKTCGEMYIAFPGEDTMKVHWKTSLLTAALAAFFLLAGCEGSDGSDGAVGPQGPQGDTGATGDPAPVPDPVEAAVEMAKTESCTTCHGGVGEGKHQSVYDKYTDGSTLALTIDGVTSTPEAGGTFAITVNFSITDNGLPFVEEPGLPSLEQKRFYAVQYDSVAGQYLNGNVSLHQITDGRFTNVVAGVNPGEYVLTRTGRPYAPETPVAPFDGAQVYGYIARGPLLEHAGGSGSELPAGTHVHLYDDVSNAVLTFGTADAANASSYESLANVSGCESCHGKPYLKHGYRDATVEGVPDFAACKSCHYDDRNGGHTDWQYMVDEPLNWATGVPETQDYSYKANIMNDVHMSHAMEFPYPQSAANCSTCHAGKLTAVLDDSNFTSETCLSCHPVQGIGTFPKTFDENGDEILGGRGGTSSVPEDYFQANRAPAFAWLWTRAADLTFHEPFVRSQEPDACTTCHGAGIARGFAEIHTGYDPSIYNAEGTKYAVLNTVSIDQITRNDNLLTVSFSANNPDIVPEVLVSFYGWDSKHFIVASHTRDANRQRMEYTPESSGGSANPLFTEDAASMPGSWKVTLDMSAYAPTEFLPDDIPTLIADEVINKVEVTVTPELEIDGVDAVLKAVDATFDLNGNMVVDNYFKGTNSTVEITKCNVCHDSLASSFHDGSGRGGDGIEVCKNCHVTTSPGSHLEMASRSIDSYVHAIHSFQDFDVGDTFDEFDPVLAKRYDQHINHVFPNFTIRNCEACHRDGKYEVPDQSQSMPGVLAKSDTVNTWYMIDDVDGSPTEGLALEDPSGRNIGTVPELVTGPASRACGGCHRARIINDDLAGDLASFNAHTEAGGTLVSLDEFDNDEDELVVYGIIDKIMSLFQ